MNDVFEVESEARDRKMKMRSLQEPRDTEKMAFTSPKSDFTTAKVIFTHEIKKLVKKIATVLLLEHSNLSWSLLEYSNLSWSRSFHCHSNQLQNLRFEILQVVSF